MPFASSVINFDCFFAWKGKKDFAFNQYCHWKQERKMSKCSRLLGGCTNI